MSLPLLVCTDFSSHAETAFPFAARIAKAHGVGIRLVHVSDVDVFHSAGGTHPWERDLLAYIEERLSESANRLRALGVEVETRVRTGVAAQELLTETRGGVTMAILATRGHGGLLRALLGSVAAKLVQHATVPILAIPHDSQDAVLERVLFPVDFSELTTGVLGRAVELLAPFGANVEFFHAHVPLETPGGVVSVAASVEQDLASSLSEQLVEFATHATAAGLNATWTITEAHSAPRAILDRAQTAESHLIVMAGHGRRGLERFLLGSVAEAVVRRSDRPVLVLKSED